MRIRIDECMPSNAYKKVGYLGYKIFSNFSGVSISRLDRV